MQLQSILPQPTIDYDLPASRFLPSTLREPNISTISHFRATEHLTPCHEPDATDGQRAAMGYNGDGQHGGRAARSTTEIDLEK